MPVPSSITDLSQTPASNSPAGSESPNTADDYFRTYAAFIATLRDGKGFSDPVSLASATTTDIGGQNSMFVDVTGTTTITSFGTNYEGPRFLRFTGALTLTHNATTLNLPGSANITTEAGDACIAIPNSTPNGWNVVHYLRKDLAPGVSDSATNATNLISGGTIASDVTATTQSLGDNSTKVATTAFVANSAVLIGYLAGLTLSTAGSSTTMSISAGQATDSTNTVLMTLAASISKTTSAWAVGSGNGGKLSAAAIANNTWYYFYEIRRPDTGVVDVGFDVSSTTPTLPTNYTQYRYIGAGLTNGSAQWTQFVQDGDLFKLFTPVLDVNVSTAGTSAVLRTLTVPRRRVQAIFNVRVAAGTASGEALYVSDPSVQDQAPAGTASPLSQFVEVTSGNAVAGQLTCFTNTSAQVRTRCANGSASDALLMATVGWIDDRGRNL